jgi:hypothetical protein
MADDDWKRDRTGQVRALRPGDNPPVSSLWQAFRGLDVTAADAIVLRGYLARSDRLQRAREYVERSVHIAEADTGSVIPSALWETIEEADPFKRGWGNARERAREAVADAAARAAGLTDKQKEKVKKAREEALDQKVTDRVAEIEKAAKVLDKVSESLAAVVRGACKVIPAQARAKRLEDLLTTWPDAIDDKERAKELASMLSGAELEELRELRTSLAAMEPLAKPHLPWRLYLTPRLDRYVDFHHSSLIAWRREPKADRQDASTVWLRVFERGAQVPILYRLVTETNLTPSFATWINGQFVDNYSDDGSSGSAWGDQTSGLHGTGKTCLHGTARLCMD